MSIEQVLGPIHRKAAGNIVISGHRQALTGPILRGDLETIKQHLQILNGNPDLKQLYARLGLYTLRAARPTAPNPDMKRFRSCWNRSLLRDTERNAAQLQ
jgi:predicted short-subunit dehydrogenase-like oxidoreductase (DUF2520 family)